ncbi:histidine phosphatase family protein [Marisediminicola sp. LYQ134]|uniref:histidine phosphatase family protein n=1 Tax=unclassified Marisediminicola TaxID=2618316 RepID=UPI003983B3F4
MDDTPTRDGRLTRIVLVRHGETEWSRSGRHTSSTDLDLTERGEDQARAVGAALEGQRFARVVSSPRRRATRTAHLAGFGEHLEIDDDLAEWDYGAYEGLTSPQIAERVGGRWNLWDDGVEAGATPGESCGDVYARARRVIERMLPTLDSGGDVMIVAHGHYLRSFAAAWLGLPAERGRIFTLDTATISELRFEHDEPVLAHWNSPPRDF